jgi:type II secretory pathway pseudopilin PulG
VAESVEVAGISGSKKLLVALAIYVILAALAWTTLSEPKFRYATLAILALFALRTWSWSRKQEREERDQNRD